VEKNGYSFVELGRGECFFRLRMNGLAQSIDLLASARSVDNARRRAIAAALRSP
jgi:hypothetical protein